MPFYEYRCKEHGEFEVYSSVSAHKNMAICRCGRECGQVITKPPVGIVNFFDPYLSPIDGKPILNRSQRNDDLARNGCVEYDPEMKKDADLFKKRKEQEIDDAIDGAVREIYSGFSEEKKSQLALDIEKYDLAVETK